EVREGAGRHDDRPLPDRETPHRPWLVGRVDVVVLRRHADDLAETAKRNRLEAVLGPAPPKRPDRRPKADEVSGHLHSEALGGEQVPRLVQAHGNENREGEQRHPEHVRHQAPSTAASMNSRARARAQDSAASTSSTVPGSSKSGAACKTRSSVSTMPRKGSRPAKNAATHSSFAAL